MRYQDSGLTPRERAEDLLSRLTLKEKVGQVNQRLYGFTSFTRNGDEITFTDEFKAEVERCGGLGVLYGLYRADPWSRQTYATGLWGVNMKRAYNIAQHYVIEHSRFGIPMLMSSECPHGHQALDGYLLPVNLTAGATWSPEAVRAGYRVCGAQMRELGVDLSLMSMLDICRDPRWGRSEECYSEDPYLAARLAEAAVRGCREAGVNTVSKHFCAQGETTGGRNASAARIGARELREIHLPAAKAAVRAGTDGFMAAYNEIDGVFCHGNKALLTGTLRGEMGFDGIIMADGVAIDRLTEVTGDLAAAAALAMEAGVDVGLWDMAYGHLGEAVEKGLVDEATLDRAVLRVLEMKFERGLFERPYLEETEPEKYTYERYPESLELTRQSAVLLKNNGMLPLKKDGGRIAVIGPNADEVYCLLGDYTPPQRDGVCATILEGLGNMLGEAPAYAAGCTVCGTDMSGIDAAVRLAEESDRVILVLGGSSSRFAGARFDTNGAVIADGPVQMDCGEGVDITELRLPGVQEELARRVFAAGKPVTTVIVAGRAYAVSDIAERSDALLYAFYPGPAGGQAIAEILTGRISPSGRLPVSIPADTGALPCCYNRKASYKVPAEGTLYRFGYGLTYTDLAVTDARIPRTADIKTLSAGGRVEVRCTVSNTGDRDGWALPQLFIRRMGGPVVPRVRELKAFEKTFLRAGESKEVTLTLDAEALSVWDVDMRFTLVPGQVEISVEESADTAAKGILTLEN